jgi:hypothetical protein
LLTTACWFIEASTVLVREIAPQLGVQIFGSVASSRSRLGLCYAKSAPIALRCSDLAGHCHKTAEAFAINPEFTFGDLTAGRRAARCRVGSRLDGERLKQNLPDAWAF